MDKEKEIYKNKKVCLIGCGGSLENREIEFNKYDYVVGINRIYKTKYFKNINILYDSAHHQFDPITNNKIRIINESNLIYYFLTPGAKSLEKLRFQEFMLKKIKVSTKTYKNRPEVKVSGKKILAGLFALNIIIGGEPFLVDIYGFDFYKKNYTSGLDFKHELNLINKMHDLAAEEDYLNNIIDKNKYINWIK